MTIKNVDALPRRRQRDRAIRNGHRDGTYWLNPKGPTR